jgi:hypothetical protein
MHSTVSIAIACFLFLAISYFSLRVIFNYSTYHKFAYIAIPALIGFAIFSGWILFKLRLDGFFMWHLVIMSFIFYGWLRHNYMKPDDLVERSKKLSSVAGGDEFAFIKSYMRTRRYLFVSIFSYLLFFSVSYLYFYNSAL